MRWSPRKPRPRSFAPTLRRFGPLVALAGLLALIGAPSASTVVAQEAGDAPDTSQFGGFNASGRANGLQITYDSPGLLPTGSPVVQLSVPEALSNMTTGPVGYSLASFAFPGPLIADIDAALSQGGTPTGIPPYPVRAEAFFPGGPLEKTSGAGATTQTAITREADSRAQATYAGLDFQPIIDIGAVESTSRTTIEDGQVVSRARSQIGGISILAGLIRIESVVTDLVATSNGAASATDGNTTVTGVSVLGLPATLDATGLHFQQPPDDGEGDDGGSELGDTVTGLIDDLKETLPPELADTLEGVAAPLNELLDRVGAAGEDALQQLFEASGIDVRIMDVNETVEGATATRTAGGLSIELNYDGETTPVLSDLLDLVPSDMLPTQTLGPIPFSPQELFNLSKKTHIVGLALAPANVSVTATPPFEVNIPEFEPTTPAPPPPLAPPAPVSPSVSDPFTAGTPGIPGTPGRVVTSDPAATVGPTPFSPGLAIPILFLVLTALAAPFLAVGTTKFADNTLSPVVLSCPDGLEAPPDPGAPS